MESDPCLRGPADPVPASLDQPCRDTDSGADAPVASRLPPLWLLALMQGSVAAASLVVEIVAGRMLAPYLGMSLYTWTAVIAVVLAGFSLGHWARSEEHTSELQSLMRISYAVFCLKKKKKTTTN